MGKNSWFVFAVALSVLVLVSQTNARVFGSSEEVDGDKSAEEVVAAPAPAPTAAPTPAPTPAPAVGMKSGFGGVDTSNNSGSGISNPNSGFQAGNADALIAKFNESCSHTEYGQRCSAERDLICSKDTNKCICDDQNPDRKLIYVKRMEKCLEISVKRTDFSCKGHEQCQRGPLGQYSQCEESTERCECVARHGNTDVVRVDDKCFLKKKLGDYCENHEHCNAPISGQAICEFPPQITDGAAILPIPVNQTKQCLCDEGYIFDNSPQGDLSECLKKGTENSQCKTDVQCTSNMGSLSRCYQGRCECKDVISGKSETVYYQGRCYIKRELGGSCDTDVECQASIHPNSECAKHPSYQANDKVCICPEGKSCDKSGAALSVITSLYLIFFGLIATKVVL